MMTVAELRSNAAHCQAWADKSINAFARMAFQDLADKWTRAGDRKQLEDDLVLAR
jgi:hypothetical protein